MSMVCSLLICRSANRYTNIETGLSQRAGHTRSSLQLLHGSLFDIKCTDFYCKHTEQDNFTDPIVPSLAIPTTKTGQEVDPTSNKARTAQGNGITSPATGSSAAAQEGEEIDISDEKVTIPSLKPSDLPQCPQCNGLLRPGVVWFGEMLPEKTIRTVDEWITRSDKIDLIMVIGTSARVYPAAGYVQRARGKGAKVAVVNTDSNDAPEGGMMTGDWFFVGDASEIVPQMLAPVVGDLTENEERL
jgi:NAD-dependent deacetylase sirtuin 5